MNSGHEFDDFANPVPVSARDGGYVVVTNPTGETLSCLLQLLDPKDPKHPIVVPILVPPANAKRIVIPRTETLCHLELDPRLAVEYH